MIIIERNGVEKEKEKLKGIFSPASCQLQPVRVRIQNHLGNGGLISPTQELPIKHECVRGRRYLQLRWSCTICTTTEEANRQLDTNNNHLRLYLGHNHTLHAIHVIYVNGK